MVPASGGEPIQLTRGSGPDVPLGITADGKRLMYSELQDIGQVKIASVKGVGARQLTVDERERGAAAISPSGRYVAFPAQEIDAVSTTRNIYVMDRDGGNARKLTDDLSYKFLPRWSPDEKWIAYCARPGAEPEDSSRVYIVEADKPGQPRLMGSGGYVHWSSATEFVMYGFNATYKRSIDQPECVKISEDSVFVAPVLQGSYIVGHDWRVHRRGWWITTAASFNTSGMANATRLTRGISPASFPPGTRSMFYVPLGTSKLHQILLPEGTDRIVRGDLPGLGIFFSITGNGEEIAYTENYRKTRFVIVEDVFN
jgi:hypothetical protein